MKKRIAALLLVLCVNVACQGEPSSLGSPAEQGSSSAEQSSPAEPSSISSAPCGGVSPDSSEPAAPPIDRIDQDPEIVNQRIVKTDRRFMEIEGHAYWVDKKTTMECADPEEYSYTYRFFKKLADGKEEELVLPFDLRYENGGFTILPVEKYPFSLFAYALVCDTPYGRLICTEEAGEVYPREGWDASNFYLMDVDSGEVIRLNPNDQTKEVAFLGTLDLENGKLYFLQTDMLYGGSSRDLFCVDLTTYECSKVLTNVDRYVINQYIYYSQFDGTSILQGHMFSGKGRGVYRSRKDGTEIQELQAPSEYVINNIYVSEPHLFLDVTKPDETDPKQPQNESPHATAIRGARNCFLPTKEAQWKENHLS